MVQQPPPAKVALNLGLEEQCSGCGPQQDPGSSKLMTSPFPSSISLIWTAAILMQELSLAMYVLIQFLRQNSPLLGVSALSQQWCRWAQGGEMPRPFHTGCWGNDKSRCPQSAPLSHAATLQEGRNKEKERVFKNTPLTAHILRQPLRSPTCLVI